MADRSFLRRVRRALLAAAVALLCSGFAVVAPAAPAATVGMSDGRPALFDSRELQALDFQQVRLVLPWDAARRAGTWDAWLGRATEQGWPVLVAPTATDRAPTATDYEAALRELLQRWPAIDAVEAWNEPNHRSRPTASRPALAAAFFDAAHRACVGRCTAVAGNLLDAPGMADYLARYRAALTTTPAVWGLHNYWDATYFSRQGVDQLLAITDGPIWLTETGGLVSFQPDGPGTGLLPDERRAADSLRWLFTLAAAEPRIARMYLYGMWQQPWNPFDSALLRVDNSERESMQVVRQQIGPRRQPPGWSREPASTAPSSGPATPTPNSTTAPLGVRPALRLVGKRITVSARTGRARIALRCLGAPCSGRLALRAGRWRSSRAVEVAADRSRALTIRLGARAVRSAARTPRTARATVCIADDCSTLPLVVR